MTKVLKHHPEARENERGGSKGDVRREGTARGTMEKGGGAGSLRGKRSIHLLFQCK